MGYGNRELRLADPTRAGQGDDWEMGLFDESADDLDVMVAADQRQALYRQGRDRWLSVRADQRQCRHLCRTDGHGLGLLPDAVEYALCRTLGWAHPDLAGGMLWIHCQCFRCRLGFSINHGGRLVTIIALRELAAWARPVTPI